METAIKTKKLSKGKKIGRARKVIDLTQCELALRLGGISKQAISQLEQAEEIDDKKLEQVAVALGVSTDFINKCNDETILFHIQNMPAYSPGYSFYIQCIFNPLDKVVELYERLLQIEREKNEYLINKLQNL